MNKNELLQAVQGSGGETQTPASPPTPKPKPKTRAELLTELRGEPAPAAPKEQTFFDWLKGGKGDPTIPELGNLGDTYFNRIGLELDGDQKKRMLALLATTASDDRLKSGIKQILPDAEFTTDEYGNLVVVTPVTGFGTPETSRYTRFYPNKKGLGPADVMQGAGAVTLGQAIVATGGALGLPMGGLLGGAAAGASEAAIVEALSSYLSDDIYQVYDIPAGALGGAVGSKAADVLSSILTRVKTNPLTIFDSQGNMKPAVVKAIQDVGLDPATIGESLAVKIKRAMDTLADPEAVGRVAEAQDLPTPVPLTKGEATEVTTQQIFESEAEKGQFGQKAMDIMKGVRESQQEAIEANVGQIQERIAGAPPITQRGAAAELVQDQLAAVKAAEKAEASALFKDADAAGYTFIPAEEADFFSRQLRDSVSTFRRSNAPVTNEIIDDMIENISEVGDVKSLFNLRSQLANLRSGTDADQAAAKAAKLRFDDLLLQLVDENLLTGDPRAVTKQIEAIRKYKDFVNKWGDKDSILNKLTRKTEGGREFKMAPEAVSNYLFNVSRMSGKPELVRQVASLKRELTSDQWNTVRQEAFLSMATNATKNDKFSGATFATAWANMKKNNPKYVQQLFTKKEQELISKFASVAKRATGGASNTSNTATTAFSLMDRILSGMGRSGVVRRFQEIPLANVPFNVLRMGRVRNVTNVGGNVRPSPLGGAAGAATSSEEGGNPIYTGVNNMTGMQLVR